ncbi:hypothetical protein QJS10_CPA01g01449 [Acorus calamus]|uniref:Uncharacterized protein n=1 Tax=Acorus calamus TaxID=4465 RepID=A0AAV9FKC1_ACOCL|nr:hypothetical protein QJS10_CPA01g01449 [Acorus calamus]
MEGDKTKRPSTTFVSRGSQVVVNEGEEEKKMEEFFTLIRKIKALKDHCRKTSSSSSSEGTKTGGSSTTSTTAWVPSFELEDFNQDVEFKPMPVVVVPPPPPPTEVEEEKKRRVGDDMDLELRL